MISEVWDSAEHQANVENFDTGRLECALRHEQAALEELETATATFRSALLSLDPFAILQTLQTLEGLSCRVGALDAERVRLHGFFQSAPASSLEVLTSARLLAMQRRMASTMERISEQNKANRMLVDGLIRVTGAKILKLVRLRETETSSPMAWLRGDEVCPRPVAVNAKA